MSTCLTPEDLDGLINSVHRVAVIDTRWSRDRAAYDHYTMAHIPLALFCDPASDLAGVPDRDRGRNPLPDPERVQEAVHRWGLDADHEVVVYDSGDGLFAARAWWILTWAGLTRVRTLVGGLAAWEAQGRATAGGPGNLPQSGGARIRPGRLPVADMAQVRDWPGRGVLVDARQRSRYDGIRERMDLQAGHIPGAVSIPVAELMDGPAFLPAERIRARLAEAGIDADTQVAVYSGSGLHSALFIQAMHEAGLPGASLYVGGWSQWAGDPGNPIVRK